MLELKLQPGLILTPKIMLFLQMFILVLKMDFEFFLKRILESRRKREKHISVWEKASACPRLLSM